MSEVVDALQTKALHPIGRRSTDVAQAVGTGPRKNFPGIAEPRPDLASLLITVQALKIAVETLVRQRGLPLDSAVLMTDLDELVDYLDARYDQRYGGN